MPLTRNGAPRAKKAQKFGDFTVGLRKISRKFDFTVISQSLYNRMFSFGTLSIHFLKLNAKRS